MEDLGSRLRKLSKGIFKAVLQILLYVALGGLLMLGFGMCGFFLILYLGGYPLDFIDNSAVMVLIYVLVIILYIVASLIEGMMLGLFLGIYFGLKSFLERSDFIKVLYTRIFKAVYEKMHPEAYIGTNDRKDLKGKQRVSYAETVSSMREMVNETFNELLWVGGGLLMYPVRWAVVMFFRGGVKRLLLMLLRRIQRKERSGDKVILIEDLERLTKMGVWYLVKRFLIRPMLAYLVISFLVYLAILFLPVTVLGLLDFLI
jgi:hypothetical protein